MRKILATVLLVAGTILSATAQAADCPGAEYGIQVLTFDVGSTKVSAEGRAKLEKFADTAKHRTLVCVVGQADKQGDKATNERLARERAVAVKKILIEFGVPERTIETRSRGEAFGGSSVFGLLSDNEDDRRVEVSYSR